MIESEEDFNKAQKEIIEPIYEKELNPLIDTRWVFVSKTKMKKTDPAKNIADKLDFKFDKTKNTWSMNWDLNSLSAKEKKELQTALKEAWVSTDLTKENIEAAVNKLESDIAVVEKKIADKRKALRWGWEENPYKEFSRLVNNYIEDKQNISKVTDWRLTSTENLESIFTKIVWDDTSEEALARYNKILEKLEPAWETITKAADETAETAIKTAEEIEAEAEKQAAKELADAEQVRLSAINEVKKRWLSQKIVDWVNKVLDFFENNVPIVKKTGILDTTRKVANTMNDVTQKNFLWSLGETISWLIKWDPNSSIVKNLAQTIIDWWSTSFRKWIIRDITKAVTKADGSVDMVKLKDFAGNLYSPKRKNQIKNGELEDVIKDLMQQKVAQNMTLSVLNPANINNAEKTAQEIAADVIADTTSKIKDPTMAKINQKLWKQSADAMVLYQQAVDTAARKMNDTAQALADQAELKKAQDSVSAMSNKRVNKQKKKSAMEQVDELVSEEKPVAEATEQNALAGMDKNLAGNIKANAEREAKLWEWAKRAETYASQERLTEKEKTLMRFGAVEEAQKIMDATSKWKKPWMIKAEFLDWEWFAFLTKLLNFWPDEGKQFDLFYQAFVESRRKTQWFGYQLFHSLKNLMFDWSSSIKTANWQYKLNDILKSIPSRITSNIKWSNWWVIYDPRVTMTKYMMESNPKEATEFMKWALTDYFKWALAKDSRADLWRRFLQVFDKEASNLDMPSVVADEFMNLYTKVADRLRSYWVEDRVVQDILNPMFYNPLEYIRWIGMSSHPATKTVLKGWPMEDMVVWTILKKWIWQWNNLPEELGELYLSTKKWADYFEKFAGGSIIRNRNALEFWDALWEYYNKVDSLPIWQEQFADWMNKTLWNIVNMWDDVTRKATALESLMTPMYDKARRLLWWESDEYKEFMESVDKFLFSEDGWLKHSKELKEWFEEFQNSVKKFGLDDAETNEILETVKRSIDAKETWESRVITNYLYDRASKNADEFMKQTGKTPDKFTPADIMNRKTMQEAVMDEYNKKSTEELVNQIQAAEKHTKQTSKEWKTYFEHRSKENVKKMVESYWIDAEEAKDIDTLLSNEDFEKLLKDWELSPEAAQKQILKRMLSNKETFEKLMAENGFFKGRVDETLSKVLDEKNLKAGQEYFTVWKNWEFVLRQKADKFNALQRFAAKLTTKWNVMSKDRETAWILAWLNKTKETAYVSNQIDFGKILWKSDLDVVGRNVGLDAYISMGQSSVYKLAKKLDKKNADNIIAEAVNRVFKNLPDSSMDEMMSSPAAKDFVLFLENYKQGIDKTRKTLDLWDQWKYLFEWTDLSTKWVWANKLANRLGGMWNFLSTDDIARLSTKYDASKWMWGLWSDFTKNIIYNARADLSDSSFMRWLAKFNFATQKYAIVKNYNVTQFTKAGQQVASNMLHAQGILRSVSVAGTSEFDELYKVIQNSEMRNLWFDIFESEWKYWERLLDKTTVKYWNKWEKTRQKLTWKKDGNFLKNTWLFWKDLATSNALMRWDKATQKRAVKSSLALATDEMYRLWWEQAVQEFTKKFDRFTHLLDQYGIKERDLMNSDRFFDRSIQILNSPKAKAKAWFSNAQTHEYFTKSKDDMQFIYDFYRNEYAPFMWKARTSMGTFFVMDDNKELGSIQVIDNNKYMFWLMKWSLGKMWEYMFDVWTAFNKFDWTRRWFRDVVSDPIFKRMYSELTEGARAMWEVEKFTNDEFTIRDWMKATVVPVAALSMFIWEAIMDWGEKTFSSEEWDKGWFDFVKYVIWTSLDTAIDFVTDRMFIYAGMFGTDFGSSLNTANVVWIENGEEFREAFLHTWARKFYTNNPIDKFSHIRSSWYETSALDLIKPETILAEMWLNQTSSARQTLNDINTAIYDLQKNYYETNDKWYNKMLNRVPVIKNAKQAGKDMWVLLPMLDKKVEDSWAYGFLKETTPRSELARLINTMEKNIMLEKDDFKTWAMQNIKDVNALSDNELKTAMIKAWVYTDDLKAWEIVKNGLNKQNLSWKWESTLRLQMMDDDERSALFEEFDNMYQTYVIDKGKADVATTSMFDKFVLAATKYGWSMSMAGYMWAYATAYKAAARKHYWLTSSEVTAWDKWDEWLAAEENIDINNLPDSKYGNYIKYVDEVRSFEQAFIVDNWDILTREKSIGIDMLNTYIENDKENFWWNSYLGSIGDEKSNMAKLWNILNYNKVAADQWLQWVILPLAYQEKKAADGYLLALDWAKTPEDVALVWEKFLWIQESLWGLAERFSDNPQTEWLIKASLASWLVSFAEEIEKKSPWMLEKVIDIIGEKAINKVLNSLTDSPTVTMADAFELATGVNAHSWSWKGKGKSLSIPSAKARENYVNKMLIPNYNKAKAAAAATWWGGWTDLPKFTTAYGRAKDWSIVAAKIPVPTRKNVTRTYDTPTDTKTDKLDVAPLPVKEWRVIGWKYTARAIQNAKVYSRRIGR